MNRRITTSAIVLCCAATVSAVQKPYNLQYSTFLGGSSWEMGRDITVDSAGNVIVVGGTASTNFPTTPGAYSTTYNAGSPTGGFGTGNFGPADAFVSKFSPSGALMWSTFVGGPAYDRAYGVEVDAAGDIYIAGRAGPGFPVTPGALQPTFAGTNNPSNYGRQNAFVSKLSGDGTNLLWSTYLGTGELARDIALDSSGNVYTPLVLSATSSTTLSTAFTGKFIGPTPQGGTESGVVKIAPNGQSVDWARWIGGSGADSTACTIRVDANGQPYLLFYTNSTNVPTAGANADTTYNGGTQDTFLAGFSADGTTQLLGTYIGGNGNDSFETHALAVSPDGSLVVAVHTDSTDFGTTAGVVGPNKLGSGPIGVKRLAPDGTVLAATYLNGTNGGVNPDGVYVDRDGNIMLSGETSSTDFPTTSMAFMKTDGPNQEGYVALLSADLTEILMSTYYGGSNYDNGRSAYMREDGTIYITGSTKSSDFPTKNAYQNVFAGGNNPFGPGAGDAILMKFRVRLAGDADNDGDVDVSDLGILASNFRMNVTGEWDAADFNFDGVVDVTDLGVLAANFRAVSMSFAEASAIFGLPAIPEPATGALLLGAALMTRRRNRSRLAMLA